MRTLKDFRNRIQEHCGECGAMDHVEEGPCFMRLPCKKKEHLKSSMHLQRRVQSKSVSSHLLKAKKFLAQVKKEGMNGIISKGGKPVNGSKNASYHKVK